MLDEIGGIDGLAKGVIPCAGGRAGRGQGAGAGFWPRFVLAASAEGQQGQRQEGVTHHRTPRKGSGDSSHQSLLGGVPS